MMTLVDLRDPSRGHLADDTLTLTADVRVTPDFYSGRRELRCDVLRCCDADAPSCARSYDSKKETGCVGLKNQGATCYMNSLLQTLFHLPSFRKAVYHMPTTEADRMDKSIPLALQSLFYKMQFGDDAVSTKNLTSSFGWDTAESFQQHDVQELNRVLCDNLEEKMKGTIVEGALSRLFEGHTSTYIECTDVPYTSSRKESFLDLQLDVKGCTDVRASFAKYVEEERMEGENKYHAEGYGLQNARKGIRFLDFPPVLQLQLKRFEYDPARDAMCKVHDRYIFSRELDLSEFLYTGGEGDAVMESEADGGAAPTDAKYVLHSVLVHSGSVHGGHYYALINPTCAPEGPWLKFDDERVSREAEARALDDNFGDADDATTGTGGFAPLWRGARMSSAYMLVYVRASELERVICPVVESDIAAHVRERLAAEKAEKERKKKEKAEAHLFTMVRVARDEDVAAHVPGGVFDLVGVDWTRTTHMRVAKTTSFAEFRVLAAEQLGVPAVSQRWWVWQKRQNKTFRPSRMLTAADDAMPVSGFKEASNLGFATAFARKELPTSELSLFLETPPAAPHPQAGALPPVGKSDLLLFFKVYDPVTETLAYGGRAVASQNARVADLRALLPPEAQGGGDILFFEESKFEPEVMVEPLAARDTLRACQLEHGDVVVWQRPAPPDAASVRFPQAPAFMNYVKGRLLVTFRELDKPREEGLSLELQRECSYDGVCAALAARLGLADPQLLRLTGQNVHGCVPRPMPFRFREKDSLLELLQHLNAQADCLYYEVLDLPLPQLETLKTLRVELFSDAVEPRRCVTLRLPKGSRVRDALRALGEQLTPDDGVPAGARLCLMQVYSNRVYHVFSDDQDVDLINDSYWKLRAEAALPDGGDAGTPALRRVHCVHVQRDAGQLTPFGDPFLLNVADDEPLSAVRLRVAAKLGLPPAEMDAWQWVAVHVGRVEPLGADDAVGSRFRRGSLDSGASTLFDVYLGMEHENTRPGGAKRTAPSASRVAEKPIRIFG